MSTMQQNIKLEWKRRIWRLRLRRNRRNNESKLHKHGMQRRRCLYIYSRLMPRCKNCKEKYEAKHFNQKYCFKTECVKVWVQTSKVKNWKKIKCLILVSLILKVLRFQIWLHLTILKLFEKLSKCHLESKNVSNSQSKLLTH